MDKVIRKIKELGVGRVAVLFLAGVALLLLNITEDRSSAPSAETPYGSSMAVHTVTPEAGTTEYYEEKLKQVLEQTEGIGKVQVMLSPDMTGVVVVAEGAKDGKIVLEITNAAYVLFEIPAHRVRVLQYQ